MATSFVVNGKSRTVEVSPQVPALCVSGGICGLTRTKFGSGKVSYGAGTVHINGMATRL